MLTQRARFLVGMVGITLAVLSLGLNLWPWVAFSMFFVGISLGTYWFYNLQYGDVRARRLRGAFISGATLIVLPLVKHASADVTLICACIGSAIIGATVAIEVLDFRRRPR